MSNLRKNQEIQADKLRSNLGVSGIPVPVKRIARLLGAQVRVAPLDDELSGLVYIKDGVPIIGVNALHHLNRQRFTIAHEIAHLHLHRDLITTAVHVDKRYLADTVLRRDSSSATGTERLEIEANQFAAALLMPKDILLKLLKSTPIDIEDEGSLEAASKLFRVSKATLQYRIRNILNN